MSQNNYAPSSEPLQVFLNDDSTLIYSIECSPPIDLNQDESVVVDMILERGKIGETSGDFKKWGFPNDELQIKQTPLGEFLQDTLGNGQDALHHFLASNLEYRDVISLKNDRKSTLRFLTVLRGIREGDALVRIWGKMEPLPGDCSTSRNQMAFQTLIEHIPDHVYFKNENHEFVLVNHEKAHDHGLEPDDMIGKTDRDFYPQHIAEQCLNDDERVLNTGVPIVLKDEQIVNNDGRLKWVSVTKIPWRDETGQIIGTMGVSRDITELKNMNTLYNAMYKISESVHQTASLEALYETIHSILQELLPAKSMYIALYDAKRDAVRFPYYCDEKDYAPAERVGGKGLTEYVIRTETPFIASKGDVQGMLKRGEIETNGPISRDWLGVPLRTNHGIIGVLTVQTYEGSDTVYSDKDLEMLGFVSDQVALAIQRKQAEEKLAKEQEQLAVTLKSIGDGVITTDLEGRIILLNRMAAKLTGWENEAAFGQPLDKVFNVINDQTREPVLPDIFSVMQSQEIYLLPPNSVLVGKDGKELHIADSIAPLRDDQSNIIGAVIVFRDITKQRQLEDEVLRARKLESVGVLAGGIAHDFNNILSSILGNISLARMSRDDPNKVDELLQNAEKGSRRASQLTKQLLTFAKGGAPVKEAANLEELIRETAEFALRGSNVRSKLIIDDQLWPANIDPGQIGQVIQNIIINADQAMPQGGTILIRAKNCAPAFSPQSIGLPSGEYLCIEIVDEGCGIPAENLSKIFDPYFSTKRDGSGLGLATSYTIVQKHHGTIQVDSSRGRGTTMAIYLPANRKSHNGHFRKRTHEGKSQVFSASGRILVMDDDKNVLNMAERMLTHAGFQVETCMNGDAALELYTQAMETGQPIDAVLLDLTIPGGMGGKETLVNLLELDPDVNAVVSSGYSTDAVMSNYQEHGFKGKVAKPYSMDELMHMLNSVLGTDENLNRAKDRETSGT